MEPISEQVFENRVKPVFDLVFANEDPYDTPFQRRIQSRLLLYWFGHSLDEKQPWFRSLIEGVRELGEDGFYFSYLGRPSTPSRHSYIPLVEAASYGDEIYPLENAIYSARGVWGIICSDEDHAILGGPEHLVSKIHASFSGWDVRLNMFLEYWKGLHDQSPRVRIDWLPTLLAYLYDSAFARKKLQESDLGWLLPHQ